jgi:hypothetical protein
LHMTENTENLIRDVSLNLSVLEEAKKRFSAQLAPDFNLFDFLRNDEMGLSACIASLLDPKGTHGQGRIFLDLFLEQLGDIASWAKNQNVHHVTTEKQANGMRRIDIYIKLANGILAIENKPWAAHQDNQLSDYAKFIDDDRSLSQQNWLLIYLGNSEPPEESIKKENKAGLIDNGNFIHIDYWTLPEWLAKCSEKAKAMTVRMFCEELTKFIRIKVNGEPPMGTENEIKSLILKSPENLYSAINIANTIRAAKIDLMKKFHNALRDELEKCGLRLIWDDGLNGAWNPGIGFGVEIPENADFHLRFQFERSNLCHLDWGIIFNTKDIPVLNPSLPDKIFSLMQKQFGSGKISPPRWPWYQSGLTLDSPYKISEWNSDPTPWKMILDDSLALDITKKAKETRETLTASNLRLEGNL